jgi:hypothetical protein
VQNTSTNTSAVSDSDNVNEIPVAVGLAWRYRGFVADGRFTFHGALSPNRVVPNTNLSMFEVGGKVGFEF